MICLEKKTCIFISFCHSFCRIFFVSVFPILCFWCLHISFFLLSPHPLPESEPDSRAKVEELKKSDLSVAAGGSKTIQMACQFLLAWHSGCPQNRASPAPAAPTEAAAKPREDGGSHCAGMALLLWKPVLRNRSEQIHSGSSLALGEGERPNCTLDSALPVTRPMMLGKSLNLSEPFLPHQPWEQQPPLVMGDNGRND